MSASGPFRHLARSFTTSAAAHQPRHSLRSLASSLSSKQSAQRFGKYSRLVPASLLKTKPAPKEPSFDSVPEQIPRP
ncbi:hypothetical protein EC988_010324, partial [Linderina pennispora]